MKFIVSSSALLKQLSALSGVLTSSATLPILECFLFEIKKNEMSISASDLETTMITTMPVESKDTGNIAIPARLLLDTLKTFPEQPLTFTIDDKKFSVEINSDSGKYKLTGHDAANFPTMTQIESPSSFEMDGIALSKVISKTLFAVGSDDLRPVMCGLYTKIGTDGITFVSTDAQKLVCYKIADVKAKTESSYIIPKKPLILLKNTSITGKVKSEYNNTNVSFSFGNTKIVSRLIEGKYPNYDAVIPKDNPNKLTIDREKFLNSIRRVSVFSNKTTHQVRLTLKKNKLNIMAEDLDFSNEATEDIKCQYTGTDMEIGFNSKFLNEILSNIEGDEIILELSTPNRAGIVLPAEKGEDLLMLVMPIMLNA